MKKLSPVLIVDAIEPCLPLWDALGFARSFEMPDGDTIGFVILTKDNVEVMYQTRASVGTDLPALASQMFQASLYIETDDLDAVEKAAANAPRVIPRRTTEYGMEEVWIRDGAGNVIGFARPTGTGS